MVRRRRLASRHRDAAGKPGWRIQGNHVGDRLGNLFTASTPVQHAACEAYIWDDTTRNYPSRISGASWLSPATRSPSSLQQSGVNVHRARRRTSTCPRFLAVGPAIPQQGHHEFRRPVRKPFCAIPAFLLLYGDVFGTSRANISARALAYVDFDGAAAAASLGENRPREAA